MTLQQIVSIEFNVRKVTKETYDPRYEKISGYWVQAIAYSTNEPEEMPKVAGTKELIYKMINENFPIYLFPELENAASEAVKYLTILPNSMVCKEFKVISSPKDVHKTEPLIERHLRDNVLRVQRTEDIVSEKERASLEYQITELYKQPTPELIRV